MSNKDGTASTEPLHITAALALLATLRDTFHLPHPVEVRFAKPNAIGVVQVSTFGEVSAWSQALGVPYAPHSTAHTDGSSTHSVWVQWNGWDLRVVAHVDAPVPDARPDQDRYFLTVPGMDEEEVSRAAYFAVARQHGFYNTTGWFHAAAVNGRIAYGPRAAAPAGCDGHTTADDCPDHVLRTSDAEPAAVAS